MTAAPTTAGVYQRANESTHRSDGDLRACASATSLPIRSSVVSPGAVAVSTSNSPWPLSVPAKTVSPAVLSTGVASPVIDAWFDRGVAVADEAVHGNPLARPHHDVVSDDDLCDGHLDLVHQREAPDRSAPSNAGGLRRERHETGELSAGAVDRAALEQLADGEEHHHQRCLEPGADRGSSRGGDRHEQVDVGPARRGEGRHS